MQRLVRDIRWSKPLLATESNGCSIGSSIMENCDVSDFDRFASIDALAMDVDGVLTDGTFEWSDSGGESKRFCFEDVMGFRERVSRTGAWPDLGEIVRLSPDSRQNRHSFRCKGCKDKAPLCANLPNCPVSFGAHCVIATT